MAFIQEARGPWTFMNCFTKLVDMKIKTSQKCSTKYGDLKSYLGLCTHLTITFFQWTLFRVIMQFTPVLARYDPFGVDVPLNVDITHSVYWIWYQLVVHVAETRKVHYSKKTYWSFHRLIYIHFIIDFVNKVSGVFFFPFFSFFLKNMRPHYQRPKCVKKERVFFYILQTLWFNNVFFRLRGSVRELCKSVCGPHFSEQLDMKNFTSLTVGWGALDVQGGNLKVIVYIGRAFRMQPQSQCEFAPVEQCHLLQFA